MTACQKWHKCWAGFSGARLTELRQVPKVRREVTAERNARIESFLLPTALVERAGEDLNDNETCRFYSPRSVEDSKSGNGKGSPTPWFRRNRCVNSDRPPMSGLAPDKACSRCRNLRWDKFPKPLMTVPAMSLNWSDITSRLVKFQSDVGISPLISFGAILSWIRFWSNPISYGIRPVKEAFPNDKEVTWFWAPLTSPHSTKSHSQTCELLSQFWSDKAVEAYNVVSFVPAKWKYIDASAKRCVTSEVGFTVGSIPKPSYCEIQQSAMLELVNGVLIVEAITLSFNMSIRKLSYRSCWGIVKEELHFWISSNESRLSESFFSLFFSSSGCPSFPFMAAVAPTATPKTITMVVMQTAAHRRDRARFFWSSWASSLSSLSDSNWRLCIRLRRQSIESGSAAASMERVVSWWASSLAFVRSCSWVRRAAAASMSFCVFLQGVGCTPSPRWSWWWAAPGLVLANDDPTAKRTFCSWDKKSRAVEVLEDVDFVVIERLSCSCRFLRTLPRSCASTVVVPVVLLSSNSRSIVDINYGSDPSRTISSVPSSLVSGEWGAPVNGDWEDSTIRYHVIWHFIARKPSNIFEGWCLPEARHRMVLEWIGSHSSECIRHIYTREPDISKCQNKIQNSPICMMRMIYFT